MRRYPPLLLVLLILLGAPVAAQAAGASSSPGSPTVPRLAPRDAAAEPEEEESEAEGNFEAEECEGDEFEFGESEELEEEEFELEAEECGKEEGTKAGGESVVTAPAACLVRRAESTITTLPGSDLIRLTVRYKTYAPTAVSVELKLKDHKGSLTLEHATQHLGAAGVLHLSTKVDDAVMERAEKAHEFDVSLRAAETPGYCGNLLEQRLHATGGKHRAGASRVHDDPRAG
jgi:hypothetical protein